MILTGCGGQKTEAPAATEAPAPAATPEPADSHYPVTISTYNYKKEPVDKPLTAVILEQFGDTFYCWPASSLTGALPVVWRTH